MERLREIGYDIAFYHYADALLGTAFPEAVEDLAGVLSEFRLPVSTLVRGGGGETEGTQWIRRALSERGWTKRTIHIDKTVVTYEGTPGKRTYREIDRSTVASLTHEIDHVKLADNGVVLLEVEWNNKDPFFDRDLENFKRLHADGAASIGVLITRGTSFQENIRDVLVRYAQRHELNSIEDLETHGLEPTTRQKADIARSVLRFQNDFPRGWANAFVSDKYATSTTHWAKLEDRLRRGVGNPCPLLAIGIPSEILDED